MPQIKIGFDTANIYQQYWHGQSDPLYAILSRRGYSVDWVTMEASVREIQVLQEQTEEILRENDDPIHVRVAKATKKRMQEQGLWDLEDEEEE